MSDSKEIFEKYADRYDNWYFNGEGKVLAPLELEAIKRSITNIGKVTRSIEIGVGTGYFASRLNVKFGVDPARAPLKIAQKRGITVFQAYAEFLPFLNESFDMVIMVVTICFVNNPQRSIEESTRILTKGGHLVLGIVPADSKWGKLYREKSNQGHIFYSKAKFFTIEKILKMGENAGLIFSHSISTLYQKPSESPIPEDIFKNKPDEQAGFSVIVLRKK